MTPGPKSGKVDYGSASGHGFVERILPSQNEFIEISSIPKDQGPDHDHRYQLSQQNSAVNPRPEEQQSLLQAQSQVEPSQDGSLVAPQDKQEYITQGSSSRSRAMSAAEARRVQWESEASIPSEVASEPPFEVDRQERASIGGEKVFHTPPANTGPALSSLPRIKLPKKGADVQGSDKSVPDNGLNQDVYYTLTDDKKLMMSKGDLTTEADNDFHMPAEHVSLDQLFHNPRIGQSLLGNSKSTNPYRKKSVEHEIKWPPKIAPCTLSKAVSTRSIVRVWIPKCEISRKTCRPSQRL